MNANLYHIGVVGFASAAILFLVPMPWSVPIATGVVVLWIARTMKTKHANWVVGSGLILALAGVIGAVFTFYG